MSQPHVIVVERVTGFTNHMIPLFQMASERESSGSSSSSSSSEGSTGSTDSSSQSDESKKETKN